MNNTFQKWQNKEISDIDCIRELERENKVLKESQKQKQLITLYNKMQQLEEAEEMYKNKNSGIHVYSWEEIADKLYNTVQLMKPYYEKYKGEKI